MKSGGTITAVYTWVPNPVLNDLPPAEIPLRNYVKAEVEGKYDSPTDVGITTYVDNGWNDPDYTEDPPSSRKIREGAHLVRVPVLLDSTDGKYKAKFSRIVSARIQQSSTEEHRELICYIDYSIAIDTRSMHIESPTLGTTYYKWAGPVQPPTGSVYRPGFPQYPQAGPYSIAHQRKSDGSISADSLIEVSDISGSLSEPNWAFVDKLFSANTTGFGAFPGYNWGYDLPTGTYANIYSGITGSTPRYDFVMGAKSDPTKNIFPTTGTVKCTVTDNDGTKATNYYHLLWHHKLENQAHDLSRLSEYDSGTNYDYTASDWVSLNTPITVTVEHASIWWSVAGGGSAILGGAAQVWPGGPVGAATALALTGAGLTIASSAPSNVSWPTTFDYAKYQYAITRQYQINNGTSSEIEYVFPASLANLAYPGLTSPGDAANDPVWHAGGLSGRIAVARDWEKQPWMADEYDTNGYMGINRYNIVKEDFTFYYVHQVKANSYNGGY